MTTSESIPFLIVSGVGIVALVIGYMKGYSIGMEHGTESTIDAVEEEREACAKLADACSAERASACADAPIVGTPERTQVHQWLRCKQSEAERIADAIRNRSNP